MGVLKIGWSEVDITPKKKVSLAGQFAERIFEYVKKPLTAITFLFPTKNLSPSSLTNLTRASLNAAGRLPFGRRSAQMEVPGVRRSIRSTIFLFFLCNSVHVVQNKLRKNANCHIFYQKKQILSGSGEDLQFFGAF